jgi:hypothetical protein
MSLVKDSSSYNCLNSLSSYVTFRNTNMWACFTTKYFVDRDTTKMLVWAYCKLCLIVDQIALYITRLHKCGNFIYFTCLFCFHIHFLHIQANSCTSTHNDDTIHKITKHLSYYFVQIRNIFEINVSDVNKIYSLCYQSGIYKIRICAFMYNGNVYSIISV